MTHWFDRLSRRGLAREAGLTRRDALLGAGAAGAALSVLGAGAAPAPAAPRRTRAHAARSGGCQGCINNAVAGGKQSFNVVEASVFTPGQLLSPAVIAFNLYQALVFEAAYRNQLAGCAATLCNPAAMKPQPGTPPDPNNPQDNGGCPPGTGPCAGNLCCYGSDLCCGGGNGSPICCIKEIGCTCGPPAG